MQFEITVSDQGFPERTTSKTCSVTVARDQFPPEFIRESTYVRTIDETRPIGDLVIQVTAQDRDLIGNITYEHISGFANQDSLAYYYFQLNSQTGDIRVRNTLRRDTSEISVYRVSETFSFFNSLHAG